MKAKNEPSKLEYGLLALKNLKTIIFTIIGLAIFIAIIVAIINAMNKPDDGSMSINEAQTKCMLMEEADIVNYMGEPFGAETTKKAEKHCLSLWDRSENPNNTEEAFIEIVETDWETRKTEVLEGYTLEQYYEESTK